MLGAYRFRATEVYGTRCSVRPLHMEARRSQNKTEGKKRLVACLAVSAVRGRTEEKESDYPQHEGGCYKVELFRVHRRTAY